MSDNVLDFIKTIDKNFDEKVNKDIWKEELDLNHEWWEQMSYVDKPQVFIDRDNKKELERKGYITNKLFNPLPGFIFVKMENKQQSSLIIYESRHKDDKNICNIIKSTVKEYKENDRVIIDVSKIKQRFNYNDDIYLIVKKEDIIGKF